MSARNFANVAVSQIRKLGQPGLLISVRSAAEAREALAGGADVIDVKEPARGALGAADAATIEHVVRAVDGRAPVTAALGELAQDSRPRWSGSLSDFDQISLAKVGLAGCATRRTWAADWQTMMERCGGGHRFAAVVYADWPAAAAPPPQSVLDVAVEFGCQAVLIDTWNKSAGSLCELWPGDQLAAFIAQVHGAGLICACAGSLSSADVAIVTNCHADVIAIRGSACVGDRCGTVSRLRVAKLREQIETVAAGGPPVAANSFNTGFVRRS